MNCHKVQSNFRVVYQTFCARLAKIMGYILMGIWMLYTCESLSKHSSSKYKLHTLIFSSAVNFSCENFCFHAIFNASSHGNRYKLIFSSLEVLEFLPQPTTVHTNIVKIIFTKFYYKTIFTKLYFQENWNYFAFAENAVFCTQLIWIWLTKDHVMSEKKGKNPLC